MSSGSVAKAIAASASRPDTTSPTTRCSSTLSDWTTPPAREKFKINLLGEYNIGGDGFVIEELLARCGIKLIATFSGNSNYDALANSHTADLNAVMCHRSINYVAEMMEKKFGIPWMKVNFIGAEGTAKSLRKIGRVLR